MVLYRGCQCVWQFLHRASSDGLSRPWNMSWRSGQGTCHPRTSTSFPPVTSNSSCWMSCSRSTPAGKRKATLSHKCDTCSLIPFNMQSCLWRSSVFRKNHFVLILLSAFFSASSCLIICCHNAIPPWELLKFYLTSSNLVHSDSQTISFNRKAIPIMFPLIRWLSSVLVLPQVLVKQASDRWFSEQDPSGFLWSCVADPGEDPQWYHGGWDFPPTGTCLPWHH